MSNNPPRKHHYIPAFYLKQWAGADKNVCEYKRVLPYKIVPHRRAPEGTGYELDLYRLDGAPAPLAQAFESTFMAGLDSRADLALRKITSGDTALLDGGLRSAWARFVLSLRFRNSESVATIKSHMVALWQSVLDGIRADYGRHRHPGDPETYEEFVAKIEPEAPYKAALRLLQEITDNRNVGPAIFKMHWTCTRLPGSQRTFLTSDRPLVWPFGLSESAAHIALPIGPKLLFVAAHDDRYAKELATADPTDVVQTINRIVVGQARKLVWGVDDGQIRFVKNRMSRQPDRPVITAAQRERAVRAALAGSITSAIP